MTNIITPRLILRIAEEADADNLSQAYAEIADNPFWQMPSLATPEGARDVIAGWRKSDEAFFIVRHEGHVIGSVGLQPADGEDGHYTISYWIRTSVAGQGFATEAANALTRHAFKTLKARSVSISYKPGNEASRRVIAKLGFTRYAQEIDKTGTTAEIFRRTDIRGLPEMEVVIASEKRSDPD